MVDPRERAEARARETAERFAADVCDEYAKQGVDVTGVHAQIAMEAARRVALSERRAALEEVAGMMRRLHLALAAEHGEGHRATLKVETLEVHVRALAAECTEAPTDG